MKFDLCMLKQPNFFSLTSPNNKMSDTTSNKTQTKNKKRCIYSQEYRPERTNSERQLPPAQDTDR